MSDVVERLQRNVAEREQFEICPVLVLEAADTITRLRAELAEARDKALDEATWAMDLKAVEWRALETKYREAGNNGPYLGSPSYDQAAQAIRALKSPKPPIL